VCVVFVYSSWQEVCTTFFGLLKKRQSRTLDFFNGLKKNKRGHVSRKTFEAALIKEGLSKEHACLLFAHTDADKDGQISLADLNAVGKAASRDISKETTRDISPRVPRRTR
jgi:hypothetical protein